MPRGRDIAFTVKFQIYARAKRGEKPHAISKALGINFATAVRWSDPARIAEIERTGSFSSNRVGKVGRKLRYNAKEREKLMRRLEKPRMTQTKLAKEEGADRKTIRKATKYDSESNPECCYPYAPRDVPKLTPKIQKQSLEFVRKSPIGKAAHRSKAYWDAIKHEFGFIDHSPSAMTGSINRTHIPDWLRKSTKRKFGLKPRVKGTKMAAKHQYFTAVSWRVSHFIISKKLDFEIKDMYVHTSRRRKMRKGVHISPEYKLEKIKVDTAEVVQRKTLEHFS